MSQVTARKTNIDHQVNEICMSFMKAVIVMRRRTRRRLELPDELDVASWSVLASDESDLEDESEDQRNKNSNKKPTQAQVDTIVGALNKRGTVSKVIETIRVASKEGGARGDTSQVYCGGWGHVQFNSVVSPKVCRLPPACSQDGPQAVRKFQTKKVIDICNNVS